MGAAWHLSELGYRVKIIDPNFNEELTRENVRNASTASLGILMGYTFRRSSGRAWNLRKRSMELWPEWISKLSSDEIPLKINKPLIQIATSYKESLKIKDLIQQRKHLGIDSLPKRYYSFLRDFLINKDYGGLISYQEGYIDSISLQEALLLAMKKLEVEKISEHAIKIQKKAYPSSNSWQVTLSNNQIIKTDIIVLCNSIGAENLLQQLGHKIRLTPVLGQAVLIKTNLCAKSFMNWPSVCSTDGLNIIRRANNHILIGATIEPGIKPLPLYLHEMLNMKNNAPPWLKESEIVNQWSGIRAKPLDRPAPLLEKIEPGLILASAHYRNGILLAPATAEFISSSINDA